MPSCTGKDWPLIKREQRSQGTEFSSPSKFLNAHHWNLKKGTLEGDTAWKIRGFNLRNEINQLKRNIIGTNTSIFLGFKMLIFQGVSLRFNGIVSRWVNWGCLQLRPKSTHRHLRRSCETTSATATPSAASKQTEQDDLELEMKPQLYLGPFQVISRCFQLGSKGLS